MKPLLPVRFLIPIGLLIISASFVVKHFAAVPDFADGFLKGIGIGILVLSLIFLSRSKQTV
ncbi:hypothetical protein [Mucilaginibacter agri]|uniref:Uncharacterized protein n=1 Tax=Mucilaginibacter agri TaxID=2695265 RepID=A0A965ZE44_9SPHI|nr:hypothetical protein [Mucilaginibacter agri]NCD69378.1 hypothetical protein [Mucilaginibacter agri]